MIKDRERKHPFGRSPMRACCRHDAAEGVSVWLRLALATFHDAAGRGAPQTILTPCLTGEESGLPGQIQQ